MRRRYARATGAPRRSRAWRFRTQSARCRSETGRASADAICIKGPPSVSERARVRLRAVLASAQATQVRRAHSLSAIPWLTRSHTRWRVSHHHDRDTWSLVIHGVPPTRSGGTRAGQSCGRTCGKGAAAVPTQTPCVPIAAAAGASELRQERARRCDAATDAGAAFTVTKLACSESHARGEAYGRGGHKEGARTKQAARVLTTNSDERIRDGPYTRAC